MERVTAIRTGEGLEVNIETLLMKLAMAESVVGDMGRYIDASVENGGTIPDGIMAPDDWAVSGVWQNMQEVSHALKCACFGYGDAGADKHQVQPGFKNEDSYRDLVLEAMSALQQGDSKKVQEHLANLLEDVEKVLAGGEL